MRPAGLNIEDTDDIRSDLYSDSVEKTYPNLPRMKHDWTKHDEVVRLRLEYLRKNDEIAYNMIKHKYPKFTPPNYSIQQKNKTKL